MSASSNLSLPGDPALPPLDAVGAAASAACALHCALLPLAVAAMPYAGLERLDSIAFDRGFAAFAVLFGVVAIGRGFCRHRLPRVLALFATAVVLLAAGAIVGHGSGWHAAALAAGGVLMAAAHLTNRHAVKHHGCAPLSLWRSAASDRRSTTS